MLSAVDQWVCIVSRYVFALLFIPALLCAEVYELQFKNHLGFGKVMKLMIKNDEVLLSDLSLKFSEIVVHQENIKNIISFKSESLKTGPCRDGDYKFTVGSNIMNGCMESDEFQKLYKSFLDIYKRRLPPTQ